MRQEEEKNSYLSETESFDDTDKWMVGGMHGSLANGSGSETLP